MGARARYNALACLKFPLHFRILTVHLRPAYLEEIPFKPGPKTA